MQDIAFHETKTHGQIEFPFTVYKGDIPQYIHSFPLHWHDEMELISVESGQGIVTVQSSRYNVSRGDIVIVPMQTVHAIERKDNCAMKYYNILFSLSVLDGADDICRKKYFEPLYRNEISPMIYVPNGCELNKLLAPYMTTLIQSRHAENGNELIIKSALFAALHHIIAFSHPLTVGKAVDADNYDKLKKVLLYVRRHYGERITVKTAADICAYSCSHFMKIFKSMTGQSFTEYLIDFRLNVAANAISLTTDRITDIAFDCGFENLSYFSRAFSDKFGVTPSEYRKNTNSSDTKKPT
ncbi:MAG: AraC family transcriptional regulator [Clostridiales bacterium]|nr:AraC family transcriptional regulator [Clostridiales bacterium]